MAKVTFFFLDFFLALRLLGGVDSELVSVLGDVLLLRDLRGEGELEVSESDEDDDELGSDGELGGLRWAFLGGLRDLEDSDEVRNRLGLRVLLDDFRVGELSFRFFELSLPFLLFAACFAFSLLVPASAASFLLGGEWPRRLISVATLVSSSLKRSTESDIHWA